MAIQIGIQDRFGPRAQEKSGLRVAGPVASQIGIQVRQPMRYIHLIGVMDSVLRGVHGDAQGYSNVQLARKCVHVFFLRLMFFTPCQSTRLCKHTPTSHLHPAGHLVRNFGRMKRMANTMQRMVRGRLNRKRLKQDSAIRMQRYVRGMIVRV